MAAMLFITLALLLVASVPIAIALGLASLSTYYFFTTEPLTMLAAKFFQGLDSFPLMAIPMFVLAGNLFSTGGVARRLIDVALAFVGHLHGGLAIAGISACAIFAAISGSSPATVLAIGGIMIPAMVAEGYPRKYAVGTMVNAGTLGILIPPSIPMIVYAVATEESTGKLFMAGIVPGLLLATMLVTVSYAVARKNNYPLRPKTAWGDRWKALIKAGPSLMLPVIIVGGIYAGIFTPTEAAGVAVAFAFFVGMFIHRELRWKDMPGILIHSVKTTSMLFLIIASAMVFAHILTNERLPQSLAESIGKAHLAPWMVLLAINFILFLAGDFMEPSSIIMILAPIFYPIAKRLGIDPIHLGIVMTVNMEMGMVTPPVGLNLYVATGITKMSLAEVTKAAVPWMMVIVLFLLLVTYLPSIALFLPKLLGM
ncbi:MAG TPA: TRAP transporter large permease subunit [Symbiobacteriaceae bacterium]|nr:TRAP transporter large permease subunit [Symbiobacteriaceae bacterium]